MLKPPRRLGAALYRSAVSNNAMSDADEALLQVMPGAARNLVSRNLAGRPTASAGNQHVQRSHMRRAPLPSTGGPAAVAAAAVPPFFGTTHPPGAQGFFTPGAAWR